MSFIIRKSLYRVTKHTIQDNLCKIRVRFISDHYVIHMGQFELVRVLSRTNRAFTRLVYLCVLVLESRVTNSTDTVRGLKYMYRDEQAWEMKKKKGGW